MVWGGVADVARQVICTPVPSDQDDRECGEYMIFTPRPSKAAVAQDERALAQGRRITTTVAARVLGGSRASGRLM